MNARGARIAAGVLLVGLCAAAVANGVQPDADPPFVELDVVVEDRAGRPVSGLTLGDFQIREEGRRIEAQTVTERLTGGVSEEDGRTLVLLLDDSGLAPLAREQVQAIARRLLSFAGPGDDISVVRLHDRRDEPFGDLRLAHARVEEYRPGVIPLTATTAVESLTSIARIARALAERGRRRKALVCIGAAAVCNVLEPQRHAAYRLWSHWVTALTAASDANVAVYGIVPALSTRFQAGGLVTATGGRLHAGSDPVGQAIERIWSDASHHYLLGYWGAEATRETHRIEVRVSRPRVRVFARRMRGGSAT